MKLSHRFGFASVLALTLGLSTSGCKKDDQPKTEESQMAPTNTGTPPEGSTPATPPPAGAPAAGAPEAPPAGGDTAPAAPAPSEPAK